MVQGAELLHAARTLIPPVPPNAGYGGAACPLPAPGGTGWQGRAQALIKAGEEWQRLFPARFPPVLVRLPRAVLGSCSAELTKAMMHGKPTAVPAASFAAQGGLVCLPTVFLACGLRNLFSNVNTIWNIVYLKYIRDMRNNLSCCFFFSRGCIQIGGESHSEKFNTKEMLAVPCAHPFPHTSLPFL